VYLEAMGIYLSRETRKQMLEFIEELMRWNQRINLTAIRTPKEALIKHLIDSLLPLSLLGGGERLLDIGSGGGFPGIPLKLALPGLEVCSVDASSKKIHFQKNIVRLFGLEDFIAKHARIEDMIDDPAHVGSYDIIISRAFSSLKDFVEVSVPFLGKRGRIIAMKGPEGESELDEESEVMKKSGLCLLEMIKNELPERGGRRTLIVLGRKAD